LKVESWNPPTEVGKLESEKQKLESWNPPTEVGKFAVKKTEV
jgi:hypothetical protein